MHPTRIVFLDAYGSLGPLLDDPALDDMWSSESALKDFSIRGLAGHLVRAGWAVLDYLSGEVPDGDPVPAPEYYRSVLAAMGDEEHEQVRTKGEAFAGENPGALRTAHREAHSKLSEALASEPADRTLKVFGGHVMVLEDYLETRLVEVLVHADDLAVSISRPLPGLPPAAFDIAISHLVGVARLQHGDRAVLMALSRRERDGSEALRVF